MNEDLIVELLAANDLIDSALERHGNIGKAHAAALMDGEGAVNDATEPLQPAAQPTAKPSKADVRPDVETRGDDFGTAMRARFGSALPVPTRAPPAPPGTAQRVSDDVPLISYDPAAASVSSTNRRSPSTGSGLGVEDDELLDAEPFDMFAQNRGVDLMARLRSGPGYVTGEERTADEHAVFEANTGSSLAAALAASVRVSFPYLDVPSLSNCNCLPTLTHTLQSLRFWCQL